MSIQPHNVIKEQKQNNHSQRSRMNTGKRAEDQDPFQMSPGGGGQGHLHIHTGHVLGFITAAATAFQPAFPNFKAQMASLPSLVSYTRNKQINKGKEKITSFSYK